MSTVHTPESLSVLDNADLRTIYVEVVGKKPVAKSREQIISAIIAAQTLVVADDAIPSTESVAEPVDEPVAEISDDDTTSTDTGTEVAAEASVEPQQVDPVAESHPEPLIRVKVIGTGSNDGSILICDLVGLSSITATVSVLGQKVDFRVADGDVVRARKGWATGGWRLDVSTLPEVKEPTIEDLLRTPFRHLGISDLHRLYGHFIGHGTTSTNRGYLTWRISEARAGRGVSTGIRRSRGSGEKVKTIPLCLPQSVADALDQAWKRLGFPSRISFLREAVGRLLFEKGEVEVAKLFGITVAE